MNVYEGNTVPLSFPSLKNKGKTQATRLTIGTIPPPSTSSNVAEAISIACAAKNGGKKSVFSTTFLQAKKHSAPFTPVAAAFNSP